MAVGGLDQGKNWRCQRPSFPYWALLESEALQALVLEVILQPLFLSLQAKDVQQCESPISRYDYC